MKKKIRAIVLSVALVTAVFGFVGGASAKSPVWPISSGSGEVTTNSSPVWP
ncbi:hypothetical protein [Brevibacillus massiliensis]|uniref:hypothetical protein n=1 Tax=Brevibacillus massiliensis TaxID=1118054 RepID=UPI0012B62115|nr:hypothetical protein [Brevibacillus massiliensis]